MIVIFMRTLFITHHINGLAIFWVGKNNNITRVKINMSEVYNYIRCVVWNKNLI